MRDAKRLFSMRVRAYICCDHSMRAYTHVKRMQHLPSQALSFHKHFFNKIPHTKTSKRTYSAHVRASHRLAFVFRPQTGDRRRQNSSHSTRIGIADPARSLARAYDCVIGSEAKRMINTTTPERPLIAKLVITQQ